MKKTLPRFFLSLILVFTFSSITNATKAEAFNRPQELVAQGTTTFKSFMHDPNMVWFRNNIHNAKGIFIVPQMLRGGFFIGGSGGSGLLFTRNQKNSTWSYPAFYTMGSVSFGFQIGADASEIILMIMTERGINAMLSTEFKLGGDISVAAGPVGLSAKAQTVDILAFGRSRGLFGGISIEGAVIAPRNDWNRQYYNKPVEPIDILIKRTVKNSQADQLRKALPTP